MSFVWHASGTVLVLIDEPAFTGCVLKCRIVGIIEGEQGDKKDTERNDRVVDIEKQNHSWADIKHIDDLGKQFREELEEFFVNYQDLSGEDYRMIGVKGPARQRRTDFLLRSPCIGITSSQPSPPYWSWPTTMTSS